MGNPHLTLFEVQMQPGQTDGVMVLRVKEKTGYGFTLRRFFSGAKGLLSPSGYRGFYLHAEVEEILIPFTLTRPLKDGETTYIALAFDGLWGSWKPEMDSDRATISLAPVKASPGPLTWGRSEEIGKVYTGSPPAHYKPTFRSNLIDGFEATDTGKNAAGKPVWKTQMGHGRAQLHNKEVGLYTDPTIYGTNPFQIEDGKRVLVAEAMPPVRHADREWSISAPMLTTEESFRMGYGWVEGRLRMSGAAGSWPALWLKPSPHWVWPPELDVVEVNNGDGQPFFTQWNGRNPNTVKRGAKPSADSFRALIGKPFDQRDWHTYAAHWTEESVEWYLDGVLVQQQPNFNRLGEIEGADHDGRMYLKLNIAVGGQGGTPSKKGFQSKMWVDHVTVYEPAGGVEQPEPVDPTPEPPTPEPEPDPMPDPVQPTVPQSWKFSGSITAVDDGYDVAFQLRKPDPG